MHRHRQGSSVEDPFPSLSVAKAFLGKDFQMLDAGSFTMRILSNNLNKENYLSQVLTMIDLLLLTPAVL